jgi:hypothetical protein
MVRQEFPRGWLSKFVFLYDISLPAATRTYSLLAKAKLAKHLPGCPKSPDPSTGFTQGFFRDTFETFECLDLWYLCLWELLYTWFLDC